MGATVVIPNYNGERYLKKCLDSLKEQSMKADEIIIVDNDSKDDSIKIISNESCEGINLIRLTSNKGFSAAVNEGIKACKSEFVILLNNDTEIHKDFIYNLYKTIKSDDNIFACSSKMLRYDNRNIIDDAGDGYTILGWATKFGDGKSQDKYNAKREVFSACAGAAIYRKSVFDQIGYFDENFFAYLEDLDISYRARIFGYKNYYEPSAMVYHIGSATSGSRHNEFKVKLSARNNIYLIYKNMPIWQIVLNFIFIFIGILIKLILFSAKGLGKAYIGGLLEGLKSRKKLKKIHIKRNLSNYIKIEIYLIKDTINLLKRGTV